MKTKISALTAAVLVLCVGLHSASASLIGMPLNLKAAIDSRDVDGQGCQFYTDDVFAGQPVADHGLLRIQRKAKDRLSPSKSRRTI